MTLLVFNAFYIYKIDLRWFWFILMFIFSFKLSAHDCFIIRGSVAFKKEIKQNYGKIPLCCVRYMCMFRENQKTRDCLHVRMCTHEITVFVYLEGYGGKGLAHGSMCGGFVCLFCNFQT